MYSSFSQFGLYRYDHENSRYTPKHQRLFYSKIIVFCILTMAFIVCALIYVFIDSRLTEPVKVIKTPKVKPKETIKLPKPNIEVIELSGKNETEIPPKRIKRLDSDESNRSPDSQRLIFFPSRTLKPPRIRRRPPQDWEFPEVPDNHRVSSRMAEPRPFNHITVNAKSHGFEVTPLSTARSFHHQRANNVQDLIHQNQISIHPNQLSMYPSDIRHNTVDSSTRPILLSGSFRSPRKNGELMHFFTSGDQQSDVMPQLVQDPFYKFKASSPYEINQLAVQGMKMMSTNPTQSSYFRRKFRYPVASIPHYKVRSKDLNGIYENLMQTGSGKKLPIDRIEDKNKALRMMLDLYPVGGGNEMTLQQMNQMQYPGYRSTRLKPFQRYYQDPKLFNTMQFPQLMPRYPAYHRYQQQQAAASSLYPSNAHSLLKPSQLVVHLNLFPKNQPTVKRSSTEDQTENLRMNRGRAKNETSTTPVTISFNVNTQTGEVENANQDQATTIKEPAVNYTASSETQPNSFKPTYYYDDAEEDDSSNIATPTWVYQSIQRDRPIYMMLKNATTETPPQKPTTTKTPPKNPKILPNKILTYNTMERPRKCSKKCKIKNIMPRNDVGIHR